MNTWQQDILDFHRALDIPVGCGCNSHHLSRDRRMLRAELIREEANEAIEAIEAGHLVEALDGLVDTIVVCLGTAVEMGLDLDPFWQEVHASNMAKVGGPTREDGKKLKPEGWVPPDIFGMLMRHEGNYMRIDDRGRVVAKAVETAE